VTGFGPFEQCAENPSEQIAEEVDGWHVSGTRVVGRKVDVSWRGAWPAVATAVDEVAPTGLLCLGVCPNPFIRLELMAKNLAAPAADALGEQPTTDDRMRIVAGAPPGYWTELPIEWLAERMEARHARLAALNPDLPLARARLWPDSGFYLCNYVFFRAMHHLAGRVAHRGFVHVPVGGEPAADGAPTREEVLTAGAYLVGEFAHWLARAASGHC
jgi:pyroglutamyl-peptidase